MDAKQLARLNAEQLRVYLEARLRRRNFDPPYYQDRGVEPESFPVESYQKHPHLRKPIADAVIALLETFVNAQIEPRDGELLSRLFFMVERLKITGARKVVEKLWAGRDRFQDEKIPSLFAKPDLFVHLAAIASRLLDKEKLRPDFTALLQSRPYAPVAFTAFIRMGLDRAIAALPDFIAIAKDDDSLIRNALRVMAEDYGKGDDDKGARRVFKEIFSTSCSLDLILVRDRIKMLMRDIPAYRRIIEAEPKPKRAPAPKAKPAQPKIWSLQAA